MKTNDAGRELPVGWIKAPLTEFIAPVGERVSPAQCDLPFVGLEHVEAHTMRLLGTVEAKTMKSSSVKFCPGNLLYGRLRPYLNKVFRPDFDGLCSAEFIVLPDTPHLLSHFLQYRLNASDFVRFSTSLNAGDRPRVDFEQIGAFEIALPPAPEQRRIVAKIEELLSDLDAGVAALERVRAKLKRYRASVLKAAVEGKLTAKWRNKHPNTEPVSKLLARILNERREKWKADQLAKFKAAGKKPPKNWEERYDPPVQHDDNETSAIPPTWCWTSWDAVLDSASGGFKRGPFGSALTKAMFVERGYKVYEQYCPINDDCSYARYFISEIQFKEMESFAVRAGDYLISCSGVTLGRITQVPPIFKEGIINQALLRVRVNNQLIDDRYFLRMFRSPFFQARIADNSTGSAIPNVKGVKQLKAMPIPLPPPFEQVEIAAEMDRRLSDIEAVHIFVEHNLKRAARLRQSILKRAFEGKLVPQDPTDEPASLFLERVSATPSSSSTPPLTRQRAKEHV